MMKHSGVTAGSFATLSNRRAGWRSLATLSPLVGIVASLAGALPARGVEIPFTEHVISTTADHAESVFAADLDGDGDIDVLSASWLDDKIAWYENTAPPPAPVPAVSEWGISALMLVLLTGITIKFTRRRPIPA